MRYRICLAVARTRSILHIVSHYPPNTDWSTLYALYFRGTFDLEARWRPMITHFYNWGETDVNLCLSEHTVVGLNLYWFCQVSLEQYVSGRSRTYLVNTTYIYHYLSANICFWQHKSDWRVYCWLHTISNGNHISVEVRRYTFSKVNK